MLIISAECLIILWRMHDRFRYALILISLRWRHNERDGVSNHQPHDCLRNHLFRHRCYSNLTGIIWRMRPANERRCYIVTSTLIGWTHTQNGPCNHIKHIEKFILWSIKVAMLHGNHSHAARQTWGWTFNHCIIYEAREWLKWLGNTALIGTT